MDVLREELESFGSRKIDESDYCSKTVWMEKGAEDIERREDLENLCLAGKIRGTRSRGRRRKDYLDNACNRYSWKEDLLKEMWNC